MKIQINILLICFVFIFLCNTTGFTDDFQALYIVEYKPEPINQGQSKIRENSPKELVRFNMSKGTYVTVSNEVLFIQDFTIPKLVPNYYGIGEYITSDLNMVYVAGYYQQDKRMFNYFIINQNIKSGKINSIKAIKLTDKKAFGEIATVKNSITIDGEYFLCPLICHYAVKGLVCHYYVYNLKNSNYLQTNYQIFSSDDDGHIYMYPIISPNNRYILTKYSGYLPGGDNYMSHCALHIIDMSKKDGYYTIKTFDDLPYLNHYYGNWCEIWSPDSNKILFSRRHISGRGTVSIADIHTKQIKTIFELEKTDESWSPYLEWTDKGILITCKDEGIYFIPKGKNIPVKLELPEDIKLFLNGRLSPDGKKVMFFGALEKVDYEKPCQTFVYIKNLKTGEVLKSLVSSECFIYRLQGTWIYPDKPSSF